MAKDATPLDELLDRWVAERLIRPDQAAAILRSEPTRTVAAPSPSPPGALPRTSVVAEALGYLGGVVILIAAGLVTARFWSSISVEARAALALTATAVLVLAGLLAAPRGGASSDVVRRLVAVLLGLGVASWAATLGLVAGEVLDWNGEDVGVLVSAGAAALGLVLWWLRPSIVQQVAAVVPLLVLACVLTARLDAGRALPGLAVWGGSLAWFVLGWGEVLRPRRVVVLLGGAGMLVGSLITMDGGDASVTLGLVTTAFLVVAAMLSRDLFLLGVAAVGAFLVLPVAVNTWFPGSLAAAVTLLVIGALLVVAAVAMGRGRGEREGTAARRGYLVGDERFARRAAGVVLLVVGAVIAGSALVVG